MRRFVSTVLATAMAVSALAPAAMAQTAAAPSGDNGRYDREPWWMREPVIAATGYVRREVAANRASFSASFQGVEKTAADASRVATGQVRELTDALLALGADKVRVNTTLTITPIYDQYRDKDGNLIANQRADKIDKYQANVSVSVEVRDLSKLERAYALTVAAKPVSTGQVYFSMIPDNELRTSMFIAATGDAKRRAGQAAEAAGARLGGVKLIDPTGRACDTDVLVAGAPQGYNDTDAAYERAPAMAPPPPPPPPPPAPMSASASLEERATQLKLSLQPPLQTVEDKVCVVYTLLP